MDRLEDQSEETEVRPDPQIQARPSLSMRLFLFSVSAVCWTSIVVASLVVLFFAGVVGIAISRGL